VGVLQRFERRIEEMVNRPFARAFKAEVQPVEIASALQRECDDRAAIVARGRTMVPNVFTVALGDHDHDRLSTYAEALGAELAAMVMIVQVLSLPPSGACQIDHSPANANGRPSARVM